MTPELLQRSARLLFGDDWRNGFCDEFSMGSRKLRRILAGRETIGPDLAGRIWDKLESRMTQMGNLMYEIMEAK